METYTAKMETYTAIPEWKRLIQAKFGTSVPMHATAPMPATVPATVPAPVSDSDHRIAALEAQLADANKRIHVLATNIFELNKLFARLERQFDDSQEASEKQVNRIVKALTPSKLARKTSDVPEPAQVKPSYNTPCASVGCTEMALGGKRPLCPTCYKAKQA